MRLCATIKTKTMTTFAWTVQLIRQDIICLNRINTTRRWTPSQWTIVLKNKKKVLAQHSTILFDSKVISIHSPQRNYCSLNADTFVWYFHLIAVAWQCHRRQRCHTLNLDIWSNRLFHHQRFEMLGIVANNLCMNCGHNLIQLYPKVKKNILTFHSS